MTQSKKQQNKVELQLPDFISLKRYKTWLENDTHKTLQGKLNACEALTLNSIDEIKSIPKEVWSQYYKDVTDQLLESATLTPLLVKYKGEVIGVNVFSQHTIGEVADTETMLMNGDIIDIARTMLTPVESHEVKDDQWIDFGEDDKGNEVQVKYLMDISKDVKTYTTKKYSSDNLLSKEYFEDFPVKLYNSILDFILRAGIPSFIQISAPCSNERTEAMESLYREMIKIQAGLRRSFILEKLIS